MRYRELSSRNVVDVINKRNERVVGHAGISRPADGGHEVPSDLP